MKVGTLEIDILARDDKLGAVMDRVTRSLERFGRFGLQVVSRNNEEFRKLHESLGDVGIGIGLVADSLDETFGAGRGKGRIGLLNMIRDTRVLGHSIKTWAEYGALGAIAWLEALKGKAKITWLQIREDTIGSVKELIASLRPKSAIGSKAFDWLFPGLSAVEAIADKLKGQTEDNSVAIKKIHDRAVIEAAEFKKQMDDIAAKDPEPFKLPDISGAIEKETRKIHRALQLSSSQTDFGLMGSFANRIFGGPGSARGRGDPRNTAINAIQAAMAGGGPASGMLQSALANVQGTVIAIGGDQDSMTAHSRLHPAAVIREARKPSGRADVGIGKDPRHETNDLLRQLIKVTADQDRKARLG